MAEIMRIMLEEIKKNQNPERVSEVFKELDECYDIEREEARRALWLLVAKGDLKVTKDMRISLG